MEDLPHLDSVGPSFTKGRTYSKLSSAPSGSLPAESQTQPTSRTRNTTLRFRAEEDEANGQLNQIGTDIANQFKLAEETKNVAKDIEKRVHKFCASTAVSIADAVGLSDTCKKHTSVASSAKDPNLTLLCESFGKLAELMRYSELLREQQKEEFERWSFVDSMESSMIYLKAKKKQYEEALVANQNANRAMYNSMRKEKFDLIKASEQKNERDLLQKKIDKMGPETLRAFETKNEEQIAECLQRTARLLLSYKKFFEAGLSSVTALMPDIRTYQHHALRMKEEVQIRISQKESEEEDFKRVSLQVLDEGTEGIKEVSKLSLIRGIVNEERNYVKSLRVVKQTYLEGMLQDTTLFVAITKQDVHSIFSNVEALYSIHSSFYEHLSNDLKAWDGNRVNIQEFVVDFMEIVNGSPSYVQYLSHLHESLATLSKVEENGKMQTFLKNCFLKSNLDLDLHQLLLLPCLHIPKYLQFLEKVIATEDPTVPSYQVLLNAKERISDFADFVTLGYSKSVAKFIFLTAIEFPKDQPSDSDWKDRCYVTEGFLQMVHSAGNVTSVPSSVHTNLNHPTSPIETGDSSAKSTEVYCFLFQDCVLFTTKNRKGKNRFKSQFDINHFQVKSLEDTENLKFAFSLVFKDNSSIVLSGSSQNDKSAWLHHFQRAKSEKDKNKVFGVSLDVLMSSPHERGNDVPSFVEKAIAFLTEKGLKEEGLFRLSGHAKDMSALTAAINQGEEIDLSDKDLHAVAGLLKQFLRNLPEPLFTWKWMDKIFKETQNIDSESDQIEHLKNCMNELPHWNRCLSQHLYKFLRMLHDHSKENKMHGSNLAIVFSPLMFRPTGEEGSLSIMLDYKPIYPTVAILIENYDQIFAEIESKRIQDKQIHKLQNAESKRIKRKGALFATESSTNTNNPQNGDENLPQDRDQEGDLDEEDREEEEEEVTKVISLRDIVKQGFLTKRGLKRKSWKVRWFVLKKRYLYYFANRTDSTPKGVIDLLNVMIGSSNRKPFCFTIKTKTREFSIAANSQKEQEEWTNAISSCSINRSTDEKDQQLPQPHLTSSERKKARLPWSSMSKSSTKKESKQQRQQSPPPHAERRTLE